MKDRVYHPAHGQNILRIWAGGLDERKLY